MEFLVYFVLYMLDGIDWILLWVKWCYFIIGIIYREDIIYIMEIIISVFFLFVFVGNVMVML